MTDKEQIEEIARDIAKKSCYLYDNCPKERKHNCISQDPELMLESSKNYVTIATWLVKEGYRKVGENEIVISKEEYEDIIKKIAELEQDLIHADEKVFYREQNLIFHEDKIKAQGRKETAEEILSAVLKTFPSDKKYTTISKITIKEIAQIYGVEIEECE